LLFDGEEMEAVGKRYFIIWCVVAFAANEAGPWMVPRTCSVVSRQESAAIFV
jgi:hypothetical protein